VYTAYCVVTGGPSVEVKTVTDSTDITECSRSNKPITGMYVVSYAYSIQSFVSVWHI